MPPLSHPTRILCCALAVITAPALWPAPVEAKSAREEVAEKLVLAGRQRMLAEGMAFKLCLTQSGVAAEQSLNELYVMWNVFSWYHAGLRYGNLQLDLSTERDRGVLASWRALDTDWAELKAIYEPAIGGQAVSEADFARAQAITETVSTRATDLVAALRSAYASELGARGFGTALLLDLYERQRMLAEQIAKEVCLIYRGDVTEARRQRLADARRLFTLSLEAFQKGRADAGVPKPPSPEIEAHLQDVQRHWVPADTLSEAAAGGRRPGAAEISAFNTSVDLTLSSMTAAINGLISIQRRAAE
ncbi:MAG: type IV pili methyl-accepting chemotaxis transducer N-terminal domain-containing protein [Pseudomonadota bacterium]